MPLSADPLQSYLRSIARHPLVTRAQEVELAGRIAAGDDDARSRLILGNLRLVVKIARSFAGRGLPMEDLVSEGNIGLLRAVEKFDPARGAGFSSYSSWWIKHSMRLALAANGQAMRLPVGAIRKAGRVREARAALAERLGHEPSVGEIASETGFEVRTICGIRAAATVSLHGTIASDGDTRPLEHVLAEERFLAPDLAAEEADIHRRILALAGRLDERERRVVELRFGLGGDGMQSFDAIARSIRRTRQGARQIHSRALAKLRLMLTEDLAQAGG